MGAATVILLQNTTLKAYLGPTHYSKVHSSELQGVAMVLNSKKATLNTPNRFCGCTLALARKLGKFRL